LLGAAVICGLILQSPPRAAARPPARFVDTGTLTVVTDQNVSDIDPANNTVPGSEGIERNVSEPLLALDGSSLTRFRPVLATAWVANADQSVWTVTLRRGVRFHTGRCCLSADDVRYSLARTMLAGLVNSYGLSRFMTHPLRQIKIIDSRTVRFDLGRPQPLFLDFLASQYMSVILDARAVRAHATRDDPWGHRWVQDHDAGTGPYLIQNWQSGRQVTLVRFRSYWGGWQGRHLSRVIEQIVPEASRRRELVEQGQADLTNDLPPQDNRALLRSAAVRVLAPAGTRIAYIYMTQAGPLASTAARRALSYAMNYGAVIQTVYRGFARRAYGCVPSTVLGYALHQFHYQTNLTAARQLLRRAGIAPGTTLTYMSATPEAEVAGRILRDQLARLGLSLELQQVSDTTEADVFFGSEPASKRPNLMAWDWWPDYNDPYDACDFLLHSGAPSGSAGFYYNAQVDRLLDQMQAAAPARLSALAARMQRVQALDPAAIWLAEPSPVTIVARRVHGYVFNPLDLLTYDFYNMYRT
jgi:peptide/nickel transport system substrate-binding protein